MTDDLSRRARLALGSDNEIGWRILVAELVDHIEAQEVDLDACRKALAPVVGELAKYQQAFDAAEHGSYVCRSVYLNEAEAAAILAAAGEAE